MKQTIEYYYNLKIEDLFLENDTYHFILAKDDYYFVPFTRTKEDLKDIIESSSELKSKKIDCHDILYNIMGSVLTKVEDLDYMLLKVKNKDEEYNLIDIVKIQRSLHINNDKKGLYRNNWAFLWSAKNDYIETQLSEITVDDIIHESIDFYIGLSENAIYYVNMTNKKYSMSFNDNITLSHKRIHYPNYKLNYLNPLSFIFDLEIRDIAEYIKSSFYKDQDALMELDTYLKLRKLSPYSYNMLMARLLYPSFYYDAYESIVNKKKSSEILLPIVSKSDQYLDFLKKAYKLISLYAPLEKIDYFIY